jgi:hypothetical protein
MALATWHDVQTRLGRALEDDELVLVATLLGDAEGLLISRIPALRTSASGDETLRARAVAVEAAAVVRVLRNPGGYRSEQTGPFSYTIDTRAAAGFLMILQDEWRQLGVSSAFTIDPTPEMPDTVPFSVYDKLFGWR